MPDESLKIKTKHNIKSTLKSTTMKPFIVLVETRCKADSYFIGFDDENEAIKAASCAFNREHEGSRYDVFNVKVIDVAKGEIPFK